MSKHNGRDPALKRAIQEAGGVAAVAKFISEHYDEITMQAVSKWKACPPRRAAQLAAAVKANRGKTTARDLCPDLYDAKAA
jgi:hypothetical protein